MVKQHGINSFQQVFIIEKAKDMPRGGGNYFDAVGKTMIGFNLLLLKIKKMIIPSPFDCGRSIMPFGSFPPMPKIVTRLPIFGKIDIELRSIHPHTASSQGSSYLALDLSGFIWYDIKP